MSGKKIRSGPEIVKEFIEGLNNNEFLDKDTVDAIQELHAQGKLKQTRIQQLLELKRKESEKHG